MLNQEIQMNQMDRGSLVRLALLVICACQFYDLMDAIDETSDQELLDIINHRYVCDICNAKGEL